MASLSRREILIGAAGVGGGLLIGLRLGPTAGPADAAAAAPELNAWVVIRPDDTVVVRIARSEMGQGTLTGLAQLVAEELECDWAKVTTEYPTPGQNLARDRVWGDMATGGSRGIRESQRYVREGAATAREMLVQAAANEWQVPAAECAASNSVITHVPTARTTTFGRVAQAAALLEPPQDVRLKSPKQWKLIGKPVKRLDTLDKLTGAQVYGIDLALPGMLNAAIRACPVAGGKLQRFDESKVRGMSGVRKVVPVGDSGVAVIADTWWHAKTALDALPIVWDEGAHAALSSAVIAERLASGLDAKEALVGNQRGDVRTALAAAATRIESVYTFPFLHHATMEPMNATARYTPDRCEVWAPTQNGEASHKMAVLWSGLPAHQVEVYKLAPGGGFGRRGAGMFQDYVKQAVLVARKMPGTPIKLTWSREEDMAHGHYHPAMQGRLVGGLDARGDLAALHVRLSGPSILARLDRRALEHGRDPSIFEGLAPAGRRALAYAVPNVLVEHAMRRTAVPIGHWRGVHVNQNCFFLECFLDELAVAAGRDPLELRRSLMQQRPRSLRVLDAVAERIGWGEPAPPGVHRGLAQMASYQSHVAAAAELSVEGGNRIRLHRLVAAIDPGHVVNPALVERQVSGSFVFGLSALFFQECTVRGGRIEQENFTTYDSMRLRGMPRVETIVLPSGGEVWGGVGEPTICVAAPAVLNAFARATGRRIRSIPLKNHDVHLA